MFGLYSALLLIDAVPHVCSFQDMFTTGQHSLCEGRDASHKAADFRLPSLQLVAFTLVDDSLSFLSGLDGERCWALRQWERLTD